MGDDEQSREGGSGASKDGGANDASNPFFVHHSDHPGMVLVPKLLNGDNYTTWCRSIRLSLGAKNKLGFVEGTVQIPSEKSNPDHYSHWLQCNDMVLSWILNSIEPEIADSVIYSTTAHEIWEDLKERFSQSNAPRIFQLQRDIASLHQGQMSVAGYFTKMKGLWDELGSYNDSPSCSCGAMKKHHEKEERNALMQFLMGLNESYSAVRGQILLMNPLPSLRRAYALVSQEEKQRELGSARVVTESAAMVVRSSQQQQRANNNQRPNISQQHQQSRPNQLLHNSSFSQQSLLCSHCGDTNHVVETCWKLHGYPSWHKLHKSGGGNNNSKGGGGRNKSSSANHVDANPSFYDVKAVMPNLTNQQYKQICSVLKEKESGSQPDSQANIASSGLFKNCSTTLNWIIDSGATDHITSSPHLLTNVKHSTMPPVKLPSGDQAPITLRHFADKFIFIFERCVGGSHIQS
ncbi:unnamed protein product [Prunus brigantina]